MYMQNPLIAEKAPEFSLPGLDGKEVSLSHLRGNKSAILFFWATWCPHCREALKELNEQAAEIEGKGIKIILINFGESQKEVQSYVNRNEIKLTVLLDKESTLGEPYAIIGVPTFFFIDPDGMVQAVEHAMPGNYEEILLAKKFEETKPETPRVESKEDTVAMNVTQDQLAESAKAPSESNAAMKITPQEKPICPFSGNGGMYSLCLGFNAFLAVWLFVITFRLEKLVKIIQELTTKKE